MSDSKVLLYVMRRDLRISDNPILHSLEKSKDHGFTHLLPLYVFAAQQIEVSGFIEGQEKSPYPEARSQVGGFWRCGSHRAKFLSESVWDLKGGLEKLGSGLCIRVGMLGEVVKKILESEGKEMNVSAVWMTGEEGVEERREESDVKHFCEANNVDYKLWVDEKYLVDDRDLPFKDPKDLPDVYTTYRKSVEPLKEKPRAVVSTPSPNSLPPFPATVSPQHSPFTIPISLEEIQSALLTPLASQPMVRNASAKPPNSQSAHPFLGGETRAHERLNHLISSGAMTNYLATRNGLLGTDFSSKLSAYLALGCITARQVHSQLAVFENGTNDEEWKGVEGYGKGENKGMSHMRFELLWRDYMRLCTRKFGAKLFRLGGFKAEDHVGGRWAHPSRPRHGQSVEEVKEMLERFLNGTTGMGLIDASQREVLHTGYTSNRARQNVASFLAKRLQVDWRIGAEWYECVLVDYDLSSNWGNWQYVAGVGNDPRGEARIFNPVKQAFDYDPQAEYVRLWVPETRRLREPSEVFQAWTCRDEAVRRENGLTGLDWVERPLRKIEFTVGRRGNGGGRREGGSGGGSRARGEMRPRAMSSGQQGNLGMNPRYGGRGYGSSRGHLRGDYGRGRGGGRGREARTGMMDKDRATVPEQEGGPS